jgi:putative transposase
MSNQKDVRRRELAARLPSVEAIQRELGKAESIDDFFGKDGIFSRLFAETLETLLEAELTEQLGYERYEAKGRRSGNSRNGKRSKRVRTSGGETIVQVPRDRNGEYQPTLLEKHKANSNEIEAKVLALYGKGNSTRDIEAILEELYGIDVSATTISAITDKIMPLAESWQNRPLEKIYPILLLDAIHVKMRREGRVENTAIYTVLGVDLEGHRQVLGHWVGNGGEGANFWLGVLSDLQARGVEDVFIACIDGLQGFSEAIQAVFPLTQVQRCVIHQIRHSLRYVTWADRKEFAQDLRQVYQAATREQAESQLLKLDEKWSQRYAMAVRSWETNWEELATMFDYPREIRRLIYTTNSVEGYHRQLRKVVKTKASFPGPEAVRKLFYLVNDNVTKKWTTPVRDWAKILNQLAIRFEGRFPL